LSPVGVTEVSTFEAKSTILFVQEIAIQTVPLLSFIPFTTTLYTHTDSSVTEAIFHVQVVPVRAKSLVSTLVTASEKVICKVTESAFVGEELGD
jgi:uncharacterized membrane protein